MLRVGMAEPKPSIMSSRSLSPLWRQRIPRRCVAAPWHGSSRSRLAAFSVLERLACRTKSRGTCRARRNGAFRAYKGERLMAKRREHRSNRAVTKKEAKPYEPTAQDRAILEAQQRRRAAKPSRARIKVDEEGN